MNENVLLLDLDSKIPNLALMKLAAHHRAAGDHVDLRHAKNAGSMQPRFGDPIWDRVYGSVIFDRTKQLAEHARSLYPSIVLGGTGWDLTTKLADDIEALRPDYSVYPKRSMSIGFTQRGCRLSCGFCVVPRKEGKVRPVATLADIWRGDPYPRDLILLDNDFFGNPHWRELIEEARAGNYRICWNQGINARMLNDEVAAAIAETRYYDDQFKRPRLYTAWDGLKDERVLFRGLEALKKHGVAPNRVMVYMLIGYETDETHEDRDHRRAKLREFGARPYPMPYTRTGELGKELVAFQRWVIQRKDQFVPWTEWWGNAKGNPRKLGPRRVSLPLFDDLAPMATSIPKESA